jgi:hypothetical protein
MRATRLAPNRRGLSATGVVFALFLRCRDVFVSPRAYYVDWKEGPW